VLDSVRGAWKALGRGGPKQTTSETDGEQPTFTVRNNNRDESSTSLKACIQQSQ
jgi:hypothetical protein